MTKISKIHELSFMQVNEDGVITNETKTQAITYNVEKEPPYVKIYLDTILYLSDLPKGYNKILGAILRRMPWATDCQDIALNAGIKRRIARDLDISMSRIDHAITDFVKGGLLSRVEVGVYHANPNLFGRGEWKDIKKLRLNVTFDASGKTIMTEIEKKKKKLELLINE